MAIERFDETAFRVVRYTKGELKSVLRMGDSLARWDDLTWIKTKSPDVTIGYDGRSLKRYKELEFYIFQNKKCVGSVAFHYVAGYSEVPKQVRAMFKGRPMATPHVAMAEHFRGLGYPSMLYGLALKKKTVLITDHHSADAAILWERVAKKYKAKIMYTNEANGWVLSPTSVDKDDWKIMYL